jgi:hypothetical protein
LEQPKIVFCQCHNRERKTLASAAFKVIRLCLTKKEEGRNRFFIYFFFLSPKNGAWNMRATTTEHNYDCHIAYVQKADPTLYKEKSSSTNSGRKKEKRRNGPKGRQLNNNNVVVIVVVPSIYIYFFYRLFSFLCLWHWLKRDGKGKKKREK